jgi:plastocyanin
MQRTSLLCSLLPASLLSPFRYFALVLTVTLCASLHAVPALAANATIAWSFNPSPTQVRIVTGESVTWSGNMTAHPVALTNSTFSTLGATVSASGTSYTQSFLTPGVYYFMCQFHTSSMPTTVTVCAPPPPLLPTLDIDGDGTVDALTDGLLVVRYLLGLRNGALVANAVNACATRDTAAIQAHLATHSGLPQ